MFSRLGIRSRVIWLTSLIILTICPCLLSAGAARAASKKSQSPKVANLAASVRKLGWIAYSARTASGCWDIFVMRPDGSHRRNITNTLNLNEAVPMFSPDGKRMIYRQMDKNISFSGDDNGGVGRLVIANCDGTHPVVFGKDGEYAWASWSPNGKQFACLEAKGIYFVDIATKKVIRRLDRKGVHQQLHWSRDGKWLCGTANMGQNWTIARINVKTGEVNRIHEYQNCTPQWCPDSKHVIFANRPANQTENGGYGWTQMWIGDGDGKKCRLVYAEDGVHVYGNVPSPDGKYVILARNPQENANPRGSGSLLSIMRLSDAPTIKGTSKGARATYGKVKDGTVFDLPVGLGWGPDWAYAKIIER